LPTAPVWDIDVHSYETHARVEHFVDIFTGRARAPFEKSMQRQTRYGPLIRQKLRDGGLPEDMIYLALIESWYDPHAYSSAAAVGMWQFMAGTARGVGLRVDWWVDERRDPVRSTEGAVRMLRSLRTQFGSLYLAAAAYDGGDGRVSRGLARYASHMGGIEGEDRFFALADTKYLRPETRDYVPKLIAAALVGKEPARYGLAVDSLPPWVFDSLRVAGASPLSAIAGAAQTDLTALQDLNPHVLRGMTPPGDSLWVRVPAGTADGFAGRYAALDPAVRTAVTRVVSRKGESMASIARKHSLTAKQLAWYNPKAVRLKSGNLSAGQNILVPTVEVVAAARDVPNPSIEHYPRRAPARKKVVKKGTGGQH
jgi:membrane-bound lytic murein transglycosylase D